MPKQVWQAYDGETFVSENECLRYEKLKNDAEEMMKGVFKDTIAEKKLGLQRGFGDILRDGFHGNFKQI